MVLISEPSLPEIFPYLRNSVTEGIYSLYLGNILGSWLCVWRESPWCLFTTLRVLSHGEEARNVSRSVSTSVQLDSLEQALHEQMGHGRTRLGNCGACPGPDEEAQSFLHLDAQ